MFPWIYCSQITAVCARRYKPPNAPKFHEVGVAAISQNFLVFKVTCSLSSRQRKRGVHPGMNASKQTRTMHIYMIKASVSQSESFLKVQLLIHGVDLQIPALTRHAFISGLR